MCNYGNCCLLCLNSSCIWITIFIKFCITIFVIVYVFIFVLILHIYSYTQYLNLLYPECLQCPQSNSGCPDKISRASKVIWREFLNPHPLTKLPFWAASSLSSYYSFPQSRVFSCIKCERRST